MIEFSNVTKRFGKVTALDNLSATINKGKITGIMGPNGAGKSTMLKLIIDINKPTFGDVMIGGQRVSVETKKRISYLPEVDYFYPWMRVIDAKEFIKPFYSDWDEEAYKELLTFLELDESMKINKISKGMRAKVKLLLSFSRRADIVLLDEPLSGIDIFTRAKIIETIIKDYRVGEQSIVITTHEVDEIENVIDEALFLDKGQIALAGEVESLKEKMNLSVIDIMKEVYNDGK
ncbi:ABC transporter ATP-binding protein [Proteinivorax tanatarense]|uniref:ABC transporter ATP-binding protein n=1 Tax=Proteinivorax tanatarense TaxID=1260629 RepID=A0AAU7VNR3_9FIRM